MDTSIEMIARISNDFATKFGVPRQSGLAPDVISTIVFEPKYRVPEAFRGLEDFSHIWLIWEFSEAKRETWSPTVRPPRMGGNKRLGVFATRSPFRPNPIGLSSVRLEGIDYDTPQGPVLRVSGADLMNGTPIYDIKPYLPYADCRADATGGFTDTTARHTLGVVIPPEYRGALPEDKLRALEQVLAGDPRPSYQDDPERVYGFVFAGREIKFRVYDGIAQVCAIE